LDLAAADNAVAVVAATAAVTFLKNPSLISDSLS